MSSTINNHVGPNQKIDLGLERMIKLNNCFGSTDSGLVELPTIHIAGTNGKGSVSAMLEAALAANGLCVGRYNSPHLVTVRDCIRRDGKPVSEDDYNKARAEVKAANDENGIGASPFELLTATAFRLLAGLDVVIIECGMGGARDATNILSTDHVLAYALTQVDLDHQAFLGNTVEEIAKDKAGIVSPGAKARLIVGPQSHNAVIGVVEDHVKACNAQAVFVASPESRSPAATASEPFSLFPLCLPPPLSIRFGDSDNQEWEWYDVPLPGKHQADNLATALQILREVERPSHHGKKVIPPLDWAKVKSGIAQTQWAGRCSWLETEYGPILADGAHNGAASTLLRDYVDYINKPAESHPFPITFIMALSHSPPKTTESVISPLVKKSSDDIFIFLEFSTPVEGMPWVKPVPAETVPALVPGLMTWSPQAAAGSEAALRQSLEYAQARKGLTVVCGSLYLVADLYRLVQAQG